MLQEKITLARVSWIMGCAAHPCGQPAEFSSKIVRLTERVVLIVLTMFIGKTHVWKVLVSLDVTVFGRRTHCGLGEVIEAHQGGKRNARLDAGKEDIAMVLILAVQEAIAILSSSRLTMLGTSGTAELHHQVGNSSLSSPV